MRWVWILLLMIGSGGNASAQDNGTAPIKILAAFQGSTTAVALNLADRMSALTGRTFFVEVKEGAAGRVAAMALKNAAPDSPTIALLPITLPVVTPLIYRDVQFDALHDFAPVSQIARYAFAIAVPANHPAKTVGELLQWMKSNPEKAFYGTAGAGSLAHFLGVEIAKSTGVEMAAVAYKGPYPMSIDLTAGVIPAGISAIGDFIEMHRAGKLRVLATSGASRLAQLPDVPTFLEQGFPIQASGWAAVFAPAKTPKRVIDQWSVALASAVRSPQLQKQLNELGLEPTGTTAEELEAIMSADIARWTPTIKASGFHAD